MKIYFITYDLKYNELELFEKYEYFETAELRDREIVRRERDQLTVNQVSDFIYEDKTSLVKALNDLQGIEIIKKDIESNSQNKYHHAELLQNL